MKRAGVGDGVGAQSLSFFDQSVDMMLGAMLTV